MHWTYLWLPVRHQAWRVQHPTPLHARCSPYVSQTINLVVATGAVKILILLWLVKKRKMEERRGQLSLGFSCVLFACITYGAVLKDEYCPFPNQNMCFKTRGIPILAGCECFPLGLVAVVVVVVVVVAFMLEAISRSRLYLQGIPPSVATSAYQLITGRGQAPW